ncbi:MAG: type II toxin-antitoxin system mRNA interferase toxin, RelE/StbE family [Candidatus Peribacteraceae bacterium]|nr:type II toxin-antitoxin system mRNA interferase toxin, RelE/StbE family [Candidatus Peribacteraceae bacterium]MBP9850940.1 type II toxin-antitoxin system mRNA interferase toxin, RelE/StbE family [Candidatus Peribacteraceae bacterium]
MHIHYQKRFVKQMEKLQKHQKIAVTDAIDLFRHHPLDPSLHNHALRGPMKGARAISAGFDLRIIFEERDRYTLVIILAVGTHEEVY